MNYLSTGAGSLPSTVRSFAGGAAIDTARWIHWTLMHGPSYYLRIMMSCCSKEQKVLPWQTEVHVGSRHVAHGSKGVYWHVPRFGCSFLAPAILTVILIMVSWTSILYWDPPPKSGDFPAIQTSCTSWKGTTSLTTTSPLYVKLDRYFRSLRTGTYMTRMEFASLPR